MVLILVTWDQCYLQYLFQGYCKTRNFRATPLLQHLRGLLFLRTRNICQCKRIHAVHFCAYSGDVKFALALCCAKSGKIKCYPKISVFTVVEMTTLETQESEMDLPVGHLQLNLELKIVNSTSPMWQQKKRPTSQTTLYLSAKCGTYTIYNTACC